MVRLSPGAIAALPHMLGPKAARAALRTLAPADDDGWQRATIPMETVPHLADILLRLGPGAQVVAPPRLVGHMTETVHAMARLYPT